MWQPESIHLSDMQSYTTHAQRPRLIELDLLGCRGITRIPVEGTVRTMLLLLDGSTHLGQRLGDLSTRISEDTLEFASEGFFVRFASVEGDGFAGEACSTGSTDSVDVVL